jgi:hypothetical protein
MTNKNWFLNLEQHAADDRAPGQQLMSTNQHGLPLLQESSIAIVS